MMKCLLVFAFLYGVALGAQVTVLQNVDLIDGAGGGPLRGVSIVIAGGRVRSIGPAGQVKAPGGANVVDLSGNSVNAVDQLHRPVGLE
jgi:imidazolonepropionase-like amidohydrolase